MDMTMVVHGVRERNGPEVQIWGLLRGWEQDGLREGVGEKEKRAQGSALRIADV